MYQSNTTKLHYVYCCIIIHVIKFCCLSQQLTNLMHKILFYNKFHFMHLHVSSTMCSSWGGQNCIIQHLVSSHLCGRPVHNFDLLRTSTWCSKHVDAWNETYCKTKFCASSWLITKINILRCKVSKTSKKVLLCLTDTSLYIYICVKHFGMANTKLVNCDCYLRQVSTPRQRQVATTVDQYQML